MVPALQFAVFRCKTVKQRADMFAFKWLCTSTDSRSAPCNHILWAPAPTLQNTWFLRVSRFLSRACKKNGLQVGTATAYARVIPQFVVFANGILMGLRCRSLREGIRLFRLLSFFSSFFYCDTTARTKRPKCVSGKQCVGISGGFLCRELHAFPSGSTPTCGEQNTANCCFD